MKWEYLVATVVAGISDWESELDRCGTNRWELVSVVPYRSEQFKMIFKRPLDPKEPTT